MALANRHVTPELKSRSYIDRFDKRLLFSPLHFAIKCLKRVRQKGKSPSDRDNQVEEMPSASAVLHCLIFCVLERLLISPQVEAIREPHSPSGSGENHSVLHWTGASRCLINNTRRGPSIQRLTSPDHIITLSPCCLLMDLHGFQCIMQGRTWCGIIFTPRHATITTLSAVLECN